MPVWARELNWLQSSFQIRSVSSGFLPRRKGAASRLINSRTPKRCAARVRPKPVAPLSVSTVTNTIDVTRGALSNGTETGTRCSVALMSVIFRCDLLALALTVSLCAVSKSIAVRISPHLLSESAYSIGRLRRRTGAAKWVSNFCSQLT